MHSRLLKKNGVYTIELTLLMPIILSIFLLIIFSNYFTHDRIIIEKACYIGALRGALCVDKSKRELIAVEEFNKEIEGRLLWKWDYTVDVISSEESVMMEFEGVMNMEEGLLRKVIADRVFNYKSTEKAYVCDETKYLREHTGSSR